MKKLLCVCLVLVLILGVLAGCSEANNPDTPNNTPSGGEQTVPDDSKKDDYPVITIAEALELCGESGNVTSERYYIRATVESVTNAQYGAMVIKDNTGTISVYGTYSEDGSIGYSEMQDKPYKGDEVLLYCILQNYNGTKEVKNARLISFTHATVDVDSNDYTAMSVADARLASVGTKVKVSGVVARVTYAFGMKPSGFMLVDDTQAIYVYDSDVAQRVSIGNKITILANRVNWILETEQTNANKFGYKGCTQLDDVTLVDNDNKTDNVFNKSWIEENTVKNIVDNDVKKDITSTIFKVNALVKRQDGKGFVNYYIDDLDEKTGSYVYTQCNGSDFAWLDEFDGKICTVYLTPLNCKASASGCVYRFLPVAVEDNGYTFNLDDTAKLVVEYYGVEQFASEYTGNPELELTKTVSSELLGFENATLTYTSSDTSIVSIDNYVMNCHKSGSANITVSCAYNGKDYSATVAISVKIDNTQISAGTVKNALDATIGDEVTIKGIVASSLVNQKGFYIVDNTGIVAVLTDDATLATIQQGQEVIIKGTRAYKVKNDKTIGNTCIKDATVLQNNYGKHEYSTDSFIKDKTVADFVALDVNTDHTAEAYVFKGTVKHVESKYYSNWYITSGDKEILLYAANGGQYSFLEPYSGQEITIEIVPCNWSAKGTYSACILAVVTEEGKVINTLNFAD